MPRLKNKMFETFNDGIADICTVKDRVIRETRISGLRYGIRTVGTTRFYNAKLASDAIDRLIAVPYNHLIKREDIVLTGGEQYKIKQIQEKIETTPPCLYLSLERNNIRFKDERG